MYRGIPQPVHLSRSPREARGVLLAQDGWDATYPPAMEPTDAPVSPTEDQSFDPCTMSLKDLEAVSCADWMNEGYWCTDVWNVHICPGNDHPASKDKNSITVADICPAQCAK